MVSKQVLLVCLLLCLLAGTGLGQNIPASLLKPAEICDNGLDDDNDGLVDCYDPDCQCFTGTDCSVTELPSDFRVRLAWQSAQNGPAITATPVVANMNPHQDNLPEIIIGAATGTAAAPNRLLFFRGDGSNADNPFALTVPGSFNAYPVPTPTIGDINGDGIPELIMACNDRRIRVFRNYTENLTAPMTLWITSADQLDFVDQRPYLADFDGDGTPELYAGNDIFRFNLTNPANPTLTRVIAGPAAAIGRAIYSNYSEGACNPTAVDILSVADCGGDPDCAGLEIVAGPIIYSIDLDAADGDGLQIKIQRNLNTIVPNAAYADGYTAVADLNLDGMLDVVVSGRRGTNQFGVYAWNKNGLLGFFPYPNGSTRSGSLACIANIYDDRTAGFTKDYPEIVVCNAYNLNCFNLQAATLTPATPWWWSLPTTDYSGFTGSTVYDFNGDGLFELVYRDENNLRILYGGAAPFPPDVDAERNWFKLPCGSITSDEYAIVADVDDDGETEIAVTGYTFSGYNAPASDYRGRLRVFESDADPWMPCRDVWNQYNYFVVNVDDDLGIPKQQQLHHLELPGPGSGNRPLNRYLSQRPVFNEDFLPFLPVPDAEAGAVVVFCENDSLVVHLSLCNIGSKTLPAGTSVAFYQTDPTSTAAALIATALPTPADIEPDSCAVFLFKIPRTTGPIFGVVNDDGSLPRPFDLATDFPVTDQPECNWLNNIFHFDPEYPLLQLDTVRGDCFGNPGSATAFAASDYLPLTFVWSSGPTTTTINDVPDGTYTVTVTDTRGCTAAKATEMQGGAWLEAVVSPLDALCYGETGAATVLISGGTPGFTFTWSNSATTETVFGLAVGAHTVTVSFGGGKCSEVFEFEITEPQPLLSVGATSQPACPGESNGSIAFLGAAQGTPPYHLQWSTGSTEPDQTGLAAGTFTLTITDTNGCSLTETAAVTEHEAPALGTTLTAVSCFGANDGGIAVGVFGGTPGFGFLWENGATTPAIQNLGPGSYALTVTFADGNCALARNFQLTEPTALLSLGATATAACPDEANGSAMFLGAAQGTPPLRPALAQRQHATRAGQPRRRRLYPHPHRCPWLFGARNRAGAGAPDTRRGSHRDRHILFRSQRRQHSGGYFRRHAGFCFFVGKCRNDARPVESRAGPVCADCVVCRRPMRLRTAISSDRTDTFAQPRHGYCSCLSGRNERQRHVFGRSPRHTALRPALVHRQYRARPDGTFHGRLHLTLTDAHGCSLTETATVPEHEAPAVTATATDVSCFAANDGGIAVDISGGTPGFAFLWENAGTMPDRSNLGPGQYALTVSFADGQCAVEQFFEISEPPLLLSLGTATAPACPGMANGSAAFLGAAQGTPPYVLLWSTGTAQPEQTGLVTGTYTLTITDANGCSLTETVPVPEHPAATPAALPIAPLCAGGADGSIDLTVAGGTPPFVFAWSNGQTTEDPAGLSAGSYALTATDAAGCTATFSILLPEPPALAAQAVVLADTCRSGTGGVSVSVVGGTLPYIFSWFDGGIQPLRSGLSAGAYGLTIADAHGCADTLVATVPEHGRIPILTTFSDTITCARPVVQVGVLADQPNLYYAWTGPQGMLSSQPTHPVSASGGYAVTATNAFGCTVAAQIAVAEDRQAPIADAGAANIWAPCGTVSVLLDAGGSSVGALFENHWTGTSGSATVLDTLALVVSALQPGLYVHTVQNMANGCTASDSVLVAWEAPIAAAVVVDSISCFGENDGHIRLQALSGGTPPYAYTIDGSNYTSTNFFSNLPPGVYPVRVRDVSGCVWQTEVTLVEPAELSVQLLVSDTVIQLGHFLNLEAVPAPPGVALSAVIWQPAGFDFVPMALQQRVRPEQSTEFSVQIFDLRGCPATDRAFVRVDNYNIYVPNVIYPGRAFNDAFTIFAGDGVTDIRLMRIYDRWGSLVFENRHFQPNDLASGWGGTARGEPVNPGVFVWYAEVVFRDGQVRLLKGDVTVVR
ncbi:MAG: VCBS repeat-containing protein [Lewinellaceae bacterium]|nr:VCBS repeat-containing protein [Lewinellaceae bacterium]